MTQSLMDGVAFVSKVWISDLRNGMNVSIYKALLYISYEDVTYSMEEWNRVIRYIMQDDTLCFATVEELLTFALMQIDETKIKEVV